MIDAVYISLAALSGTALGSVASSLSNWATMRRQEVSCLVFRILMSLKVSEKKATSDPDNTKESRRRKRIMMARMVVA